MRMSGEELIPATRRRVWDALNDPDVLRQCIPGCEEITKKSPTEFEARVVAKVGPVKAGFTGAVRLSDLDPPKSYTISGEGKGGPAGFARGGAKVRLTEEGASTRLAYDVEAQVGGKLAQIGSRLIDSTAKKMADQFFGRFAEIAGGGAARSTNGPVAVEGEAPAGGVATPSVLPEAAIVAPPRAGHTGAPSEAAARFGGNLIWWLVAVVVVAALLLYLIGW